VTTRQIRWAFFFWLLALFFVVTSFATYFGFNARTRPSVFVPPAIWSERLNPFDPPPQYDI